MKVLTNEFYPKNFKKLVIRKNRVTQNQVSGDS